MPAQMMFIVILLVRVFLSSGWVDGIAETHGKKFRAIEKEREQDKRKVIPANQANPKAQQSVASTEHAPVSWY